VIAMMQRADGRGMAASCYDDMPFTRVLFRYLWPFWLFKDVSRGDCYTRAAAYRHNRNMRVYLPGYMMKWILGSVVAFSLVVLGDSARRSDAWDIFTLLVAGAAIVFAGSLCVLFVTGYVYVYLNRNDIE
jgi:hypothetical protein